MTVQLNHNVTKLKLHSYFQGLDHVKGRGFAPLPSKIEGSLSKSHTLGGVCQLWPNCTDSFVECDNPFGTVLGAAELFQTWMFFAELVVFRDVLKMV